MPYDIKKSDSCPASKPYAVIKRDDGKVMGCHPTRKAAAKQIAAIQVNESTHRIKEGMRQAGTDFVASYFAGRHHK